MMYSIPMSFAARHHAEGRDSPGRRGGASGQSDF